MASRAGLSLAIMYVGDLDASVSFYTEVLGLEIADREPAAALLVLQRWAVTLLGVAA
jgi:catechol 2,3-dioxygenase-like lactoylglutathione lyase family enzyme